MILPLSVDRRLRDSASRVFRTLQNVRKKKSMVTGVVLNRTREFSHEENGSLGSVHTGVVRRYLQLVVCRGRSSAANVLAVALPREISARGKAIKRGKTACGLSGLRVACQCGP